jgi:trimeric autotransporter adhesin
VRADEKLTAFVELELVTGACGELPRQAGEILRNFRDMKPSIPPVLITFALFCFALVQNTQAVLPAPDGGYGPPAYGLGNTAEGQDALLSLTFGEFNTATGYFSLKSNTTGEFNTAIGAAALQNNTAGLENTAIGYDALFSNTFGEHNIAIGSNALLFNTTGSENTAIGRFVLRSNTLGDGNTAIGVVALANDTTGSRNTVVGDAAGSAVTTANDIICIGEGVAGANVNNSCYIGSIFGQTSSGGAAVFINSNGKLGTTTSSRRFKEEIRPMDKISEALFSLKPVSFHYKKEIDPAGTSQFGLVAEDVEKVNPDLVVRDKEGKPYTVRYDQVNAMLLNEFLKEHRKVEDLESNAARQQKQIEALTVGLQKVSAQLEVSRSAPQVTVNDQ